MAELDLVREQLAAGLRVLPGVREVLAQLGALPMRQTLLTGNFESAARLKLACKKLDHYFDFAIGAFGSDHHDRNRLVAIALEKARRVYGLSFEPQQVVVIGDTPLDIA